ncbi:unnamed protein product [Lactuca saligna]|uniref:Uncharacterized protein n=1 Tax=Lactuca saligna TaxID=75948 RepID=A0AA35ZC98_LACSI|nr:unnamed protein product [Lactuca saligna]
MSKPIYEFVPNTHVIKGSNASDSPIIQVKNVAFSDEIPKQIANSRIKDFVNYVKSCPLRTIREGRHRVTIDVECFQTALRLPRFENYSETPSEESCILDYAQLFLDQMIDCIIGNKKPMYVPYPHWHGLILSRKEGFVEIHEIFIPIPALSSKIINVTASEDDSKEDNDEDVDKENDEDDYEEGTSTPPNSPSDNPPSPPPPSRNFPLLSHPPPHTPSPPFGSPPQSDVAQKGENNQGFPDQQTQLVVTTPTPSQPEISET